MRLRIESVSGSPINEYQIRDGSVDFRSLDPSGRAYPGLAGRWRTLDDNDLKLHHALGTVVSKWLRVRLGNGASVLDRAVPFAPASCCGM